MSKSFWKGLEKTPGVGFEKPKEVIKFTSPGLNFLFGPFGGVPAGFSACFWGGIRSGKTTIIRDAIANLHKSDPTAAAILFDCEMRSAIQSTGAASAGIDPERLLVKQTNSPIELFDFIERDVPAAIEEGLNLKLICIDSISAIRGRRSLNADTIEVMNIGDRSLTNQEGMARILPILRRKGIVLLTIAQQRAQLDPVQVMMRKTKRPDANLGFLHLVEFVIQVDQIESKDGKIFNEKDKDGDDKFLMSGNQIRVTMNESSAGGKGRSAIATLDYQKGFINLGEEVATLGKNLGVIQQPEGTRSYLFGSEKYNGFPALCEALEKNEALRNEVVNAIMTKTKGQE